jgi:hypothetical protein
LAHDRRTGIGGLLARLIFLRWYRCSHECGWRGLCFSHSLLQAEGRRVMRALILLLLIVAAAAIVYLVLSREGPHLGGSGADS